MGGDERTAEEPARPAKWKRGPSLDGQDSRDIYLPGPPSISRYPTHHRLHADLNAPGSQLEKKRLDYERLREHKRRFEAEIQLLDAQTQQSERELALMQEDLGRFSGHQSEPTTPPEYRETSSGFPTMFSRPNRYSASSLTSPPGIFNRPGRSGSQLASPQSGFMPPRYAFDDQLPSKSVPGSRRNSDEDEKEEAVRQDPTSHRSTNAYVSIMISSAVRLVLK